MFVGILRVFPNWCKGSMKSLKACGVIKNWWTLGRVLEVSLRVLRFEVP